jgi:protein-arginine kinase
MLGGVFAGTFRGLQFSHVDSHAAYSLGNLSHVRMVELLEAEGGIGWYDLGSEMEYKKRWAEVADELVMALVMRG